MGENSQNTRSRPSQAGSRFASRVTPRREAFVRKGLYRQYSIHYLVRTNVCTLYLLSRAEADRHGALLLLAISAGMRPGEYEALAWQAVDLEAGRVNVCRAIARLRKGGWRFEATKTGRDRVVPIPPVVVRALKTHRARQAEARLAAGTAWQDYDLVFANELGGLSSTETS